MSIAQERSQIRRQLSALGLDVDQEIIYRVSTSDYIRFDISTEPEQKRNTAKYAVEFFPEYKCFVVWSMNRHRPGECSHCLTLKDKIKNISLEDGVISFYKRLNRSANNRRLYEKVVVVSNECGKEFFSHLSFYLSANREDPELPTENICDFSYSVDWCSEHERKRYSIKQLSRNYRFSKEVKRAYGYECAICRCNVVPVLQAAHERGWEVCSTRRDYVKHGICLCANHHLMYDNGLIDIDLRARTIDCKENPQLIETEWYRTFMSQYGGKIKETTRK